MTKFGGNFQWSDSFFGEQKEYNISGLAEVVHKNNAMIETRIHEIDALDLEYASYHLEHLKMAHLFSAQFVFVGNRGVGNLRFIGRAGALGLGLASRVFKIAFYIDSLPTATIKISILRMLSYDLVFQQFLSQMFLRFNKAPSP